MKTEGKIPKKLLKEMRKDSKHLDDLATGLATAQRTVGRAQRFYWRRVRHKLNIPADREIYINWKDGTYDLTPEKP